MLSWSEYVKQGVIRKTVPNNGRIKALIIIADARINTISKVNMNKNNASIIFTNYYDSLREICEAITLSKGYKIYLHEAVGLFLREILKENVFFIKFDKYRIMRNGVNYYGTPIPLEEALQYIKEVKVIIDQLKLKYLKYFI